MKISYKVLCAVIIFQFMSCTKTKPEVTIKQSTNTKVILADKPIEETQIELDHFSYPVDSILKVSILQTETFHNDEVDQNLEKKTWFGIFKENENYTLKETKITIINDYDPVIDEDESEKTGWNVSASIKDTCLVLIEKQPYLTNRKISSIKIKEEILPNQKSKFYFKDIEYTLFATGDIKKGQGDSENGEISNYKLYLETKINGEQKTTLLVARKNFDDQMINILFAGDIDGDDKLDLIIDTASHYNVSSPTLYLSKPAAAEGKIIKPIGIFTYVGC